MKRYYKFNFVFFLNTATDYYKYMLYDIFALNNVRVIDCIYGRTSFNFKPYRPATNPLSFGNSKSFDASSPQAFVQSVARDFPTNDPIVFFFWMNDYYLFRSLDFFNYLRDNYPNCKLVCWLTNPIHCYQGLQMFCNEASTKEILSTFDCVLTYVQLDAMAYGMTYFEEPYSVLPYAQPKLSSDVFFVGRPKDRLEKILRAYESFKAAGLICDFYIADVHNTPPLVPSDDLHFNEYLTYDKVLEHVLRSRAVLDIAQRGTYGLTPRYFESLAYNKNFITDNPFYRQDRFTSPKLFLIDKSFEIDKEQFMAAAKLSSNYKNEYSPLYLINFLESFLNS